MPNERETTKTRTTILLSFQYLMQTNFLRHPFELCAGAPIFLVYMCMCVRVWLVVVALLSRLLNALHIVVLVLARRFQYNMRASF